MKPKTGKRKSGKRQSAEAVPERVRVDVPSGPGKMLDGKRLDETSARVETGIEDTAAWKELVRRMGRGKATRLLKAGILRRLEIACH